MLPAVTNFVAAVSQAEQTGGSLGDVLADQARQRRQERFLRTVHGFGYAFIGEVTLGGAAATAARLVWEDAVFELRPGEHVLGRSEEAQVRLDAPGVSRRHARIVVTSDEATIEDLASKNGTYVGERRLEGPSALHDGDRVRLGSQLLVFRRAGSGAWRRPGPRAAHGLSRRCRPSRPRPDDRGRARALLESELVRAGFGR